MVGHQLTPAASSSATSDSQATSSADRRYRYWAGVGSAVICGICFGIAPGIVSIYLPFYGRMKDCAAHTAQSTCLSAPNAHCEWVGETCRFNDWRIVNCPAYNGDPVGCAAVTASSSSASHGTAQTPLLTPAPVVTHTLTLTMATVHVPSPPPPPLPPATALSHHATTHAGARFNWIGDGALRRSAHAAAAEGSTVAAASSSVATDDGVCSYDYETQTCAHVAGYDDTQTGVYAAASTALGAVVPLAIDAVRKRHGLPAAFATCAAIAVLSNVLASWSLLTDAFAVMVEARLIYGGIAYAVMGLCMSFVEASAPAATPAAGMALNFAVNLTYLLLDTYGVYAPKLSANYFWLLEGLHGFQWIITIAVVLFIPVAANVLKRPSLPTPSAVPVPQVCVRGTDELSVISGFGCEKDATSSNCDANSFNDALPRFLARASELATSVATTATASSGTSTAATLSPACTPPPQELVMMPAAPCLVVSPALGSPPRERHVSFAAAAPQVVMLTAASSAAPSPSHQKVSTGTCDEIAPSRGGAAASQVADAAGCGHGGVVDDVSSGDHPSSAAARTHTSDKHQQRDDSLSRSDHGCAASPSSIIIETTNVRKDAIASTVEVNATSPSAAVAEEETSFMEDLRALVTTYRAPLLRGILIASLENGCGIAAVTNFAPILLESSGFDPMQGNLVCGLAYVVGAALGPAAERRFSVRSRAFASAFAMSAAALVIGLSVLPPVDLGLLTVAGLVAWIGALSAVYAPIYYYASVKLFPPTCQATASAVMLMTSAFWTLVESAVFPSVVTALSGGENGDKRWGRGLTFMAFAVLGTALSLLLVKTFKTWDEVEAEARLENEITTRQMA